MSSQTSESDTGEDVEALSNNGRQGWARFLPSIQWLRNYSPGKAQSDALVALFVAALLVPQAMAYAQLAGLDPRIGLAAAIAPPVLYAFFGTSRYLSIGPTALLSLLTAASVASAGKVDASSVLAVVALLAVMVGLIQLVIGVARLGFITNFISDPALSGFINGAAILIFFSQVPTFLGLQLDARSVLDITMGVFRNLDSIQLDALILGGAALAGFVLLPPAAARLAGALGGGQSAQTVARKVVPLLVVVAAIIVTWQLGLLTDLEQPVVGAVAAGLPELHWPTLDARTWSLLAADAFAIALLGYILALGAANSLAGRERQSISPDHEAVALGLGNISAGLTGGYPVGASLSRSAVVYDAGGSSPLGSVGAGLVILLILIFGGPMFAHLPATVLAALIMSAVVSLLTPKEIWKFIRYSKSDATAVLVSLLATVFLGVRYGIALGAAISLLLFLWRTSRPRIVVEGADRSTGRMQDVDRRNVEEVCGSVLVLRIDESLYFANARYCERVLLEAVAQRQDTSSVVLDLKTVGHMDASALNMLERVREALTEAGIELRLSNARKPVLLKLRHMGFMRDLPAHHRSTEEAARKSADNGPEDGSG